MRDQLTAYPARKRAAATAGRVRRWWIGALVVLSAGVFGCSDAEQFAEPTYLLRVGEDAVTVLEYERAFELAKAAYPHSALQNRGAERAIRLRVLREMTEELILRQRARELGLSVSDAELDRAESDIRTDYPEGAFEEVLLESAVSYAAWKEKLASRLLIEKVIRNDLESRIRISADDVARYYQERGAGLAGDNETEGGRPAKAIDERIVDDLRRKKAEEAYSDWIDTLRQKYYIDINVAQWQQISESGQTGKTP